MVCEWVECRAEVKVPDCRKIGLTAEGTDACGRQLGVRARYQSFYRHAACGWPMGRVWKLRETGEIRDRGSLRACPEHGYGGVGERIRRVADGAGELAREGD